MEPLTAAIVIFIVSILLLGGSSAYLVRALAFIAQKIGISEFVIGSVILAMGTTLPELTSTVIANLQGKPELGVGVVIGSVVTNLCLILGIVSLLREQKIEGKTEKRSFLFALAPLILFALLAFNGTISRWEGVLLVGVFAMYLYYMFSQGILVSRKRPQFKTMHLHYLMVPLAIFTIIIASRLLVDTAQYVALAVGIPLAVVGLIIVAFGTSVPELASSIAATVSGEQNLAVGDLVGANITVVLFVIGVAAIIRPITIVFRQFYVPLFIGLGATAWFMSYVTIRHKTDRFLGASLLGIYVVYLALTWLRI